eukprot:4511856-Amphidinium_carterae.1
MTEAYLETEDLPPAFPNLKKYIPPKCLFFSSFGTVVGNTFETLGLESGGSRSSVSNLWE